MNTGGHFHFPNWFFQYHLILLLLLVACSSTPSDSSWKSKEIGEYTYEIPPGWDLIKRTDRALIYTHGGTPFHFLRVTQTHPGDSYSNLNSTYAPDQDRWTLAEKAYMNLVSSSNVIDAELLTMKPHPALPEKGYYLEAEVSRTNGFSYRYLIVGGFTGSHYLRFTLAAELEHSYPELNETFDTFLRRLTKG